MAILNLNLENGTTREEINEYLRQMALHSDLHKQIDYVDSQEVVSTDFVGSRHAGIVDAGDHLQDNHVVLYVWYDNEFGYSCQVVRVMEDMAGVNPPAFPAKDAASIPRGRRAARRGLVRRMSLTGQISRLSRPMHWNRPGMGTTMEPWQPEPGS